VKVHKNIWVRYLFIILGIISLGLGALGVLLPVLPTTPFLLLSAALFIRGSEKYYHWLLNHRLFGKFISDYINHKSVPLVSKVIALIMLWTTILSTVIFFLNALWLQIILIVIASAVSVHILLLKTK